MQRHNGFAAQKKKKKKKIVRVRLELPTLMLSARNAKEKRSSPCEARTHDLQVIARETVPVPRGAKSRQTDKLLRAHKRTS